MATDQVKFSGIADIYLQGYDALQPLGSGPEKMAYYIGCGASNIIVHDFRRAPAIAAQLALTGIDEEKFADIFNCPGWVEIREEQEETTISIRDRKINGEERSILWLGILYNEELDEKELYWKSVSHITESITAFAAIVP